MLGGDVDGKCVCTLRSSSILFAIPWRAWMIIEEDFNAACTLSFHSLSASAARSLPCCALHLQQLHCNTGLDLAVRSLPGLERPSKHGLVKM
jgi:hypothetical protein